MTLALNEAVGLLMLLAVLAFVSAVVWGGLRERAKDTRERKERMYLSLHCTPIDEVWAAREYHQDVDAAERRSSWGPKSRYIVEARDA
jgi:hypothetical protein